MAEFDPIVSNVSTRTGNRKHLFLSRFNRQGKSMLTAQIIPGLTMDETLYDAAAECLAIQAHDQRSLTWEEFTDPVRWWLVPSPENDDDGVPLAYKAEFEVIRTLARTIKVNVWYRPDLRRGETSRPHTHPWEMMEAFPVAGGYIDEHWYRTTSGDVVQQGSAHQVPGEVNRFLAMDYHEVTEVLYPGKTVSVMVCGRWISDQESRGVWGHLDLHTGEHVPIQYDRVEQDLFRARLYSINPQHPHPAEVL